MQVKAIKPFGVDGKIYEEGALATLDDVDAKRVIWLGYAVQNTKGETKQCKNQKLSSMAKPLK